MDADPRAQDFVLGALSPAERASIVRARLYDRDLDLAIDLLEQRFGALGLAGLPDGDPGLWERIDAAIALERRELAGKHIEPAADGKWFEHVPGIDAKRLWTPDTVLLRCVPGASDAPHEQERDEHIIVIAGDLIVGGRTLGAGDHLFLPIGSRHPAMHTAAGCLLFIQFR